MKVLQFTIPVAPEKSVIIQEEILPHFYTHFHRHTEFQVTWILAGEGTLLTGNSMQRFQRNDIFIIGPNQPHVFKNDPEYFDKRLKKKVRSLTLYFNCDGLISPILEIPEMKAVKEFIKLAANGLQASPLNRQIAADCLLKIKRNKGGFRLAAFIELLQLLANFGDWKILSNNTLPVYITDSEGLRMNDIYQYTMTHYTENISIEKIAAVACLTPPAFCRYFKKHTRKTYVNFLNEIRINEACKQIVNGDCGSLAAIAYKNGFNNSVTFNRVFRKLKGRTPGEYLREYNKSLGFS